MNTLVHQAHEQSRDIDAKIREFHDQVNGVLSWVPPGLGHLVDPIRHGLEALGSVVRDFWDQVSRLWEQPGDSDRLKQVGERWVTDVGNILGDVAGTIGLDKLRTDTEWEGRAANAYHVTVPPQAAGLNAVKDIANQLRTSLTSLANSIDMFWIAIGFAFGAFLIGAVAAIAAACTVVGIPVAIGALATAAGTSLGLVAAAVVALESHTNTIETEQTAIRQKVRDLGSTWAVPNTRALSDASVTDGDASDWRPTR